MDTLFNKLENLLVPFATKMAGNKYLKSISNGFSMCLPVFILGAIFSLLSGLQLGGYQDFITNIGIKQYFLIIPKVTTDLLSVYVVYTISSRLASEKGHKNESTFVGLLSIMAFFTLIPTGTFTAEGESLVSAIPFQWLGSAGLFMSIIIAILVSSIYCFVIDKNWTITLPDGVPPTIAKSFSSLIPGTVIGIIFLIIAVIFSKTSNGDAFSFVYGLIKAPLGALSGSLLTMILLGFLASLFWFFGIHGAMVTMPFSMMLFTEAGMINQEAYAAGKELPNILTGTLGSITLLGGIGATLSLALIMLLFAKSKRYKSLGKLSILPGLCGINEPIMFGFPLVLNPIMAIPFLTVPIINTLIVYFTMSIGLVSKPRIATFAFGTPVFLDSFLVSGIAAVILQVLLIAIDMLIYFPFFKVQDNQALKEELTSEDVVATS